MGNWRLKLSVLTVRANQELFLQIVSYNCSNREHTVG